MQFKNIEEVAEYLCNSTLDETKYSYDSLNKTKNFLKKFVHSPKMERLELVNTDEHMMEIFRRRHPHNKVINTNTFEVKLFDFDEKYMIFVSIGDINNDGSFIVEAEGYGIIESEVKSNKEAKELLEVYYKEVEYDEMNDAINYHRNYQARKDRKATENSEIARKFENFTING